MYKSLLPILLISICFVSCKKEKNSGTFGEKMFEKQILNQKFVVSLAEDHGLSLTANYTGCVFILQKTDYYHGPLQASKNGRTYIGSWKANDDYGKLTITLPSPPDEFGFLSRDWRFKSKNLPTLKLAPWGQPDGISVNMTRQ